MFAPLIRAYRTRLSLQLLLPQLLLTLLLGGAGVFMVHFHTNDQMVEQLRSRGEFIVQSLERTASSAANADAFGAYVEALGSARGVELMLVSSGADPHVVAATDWNWVGRRVSTLPGADYRDDIERVLATGTTHYDAEQGGGEVFDYSAPLDLQPLYPGRSAVMVHLTIAEDKATAQRTARLLSITLLALIFGLSTLQIGALRRRVLRPQAELLKSITAREAGEQVRAVVIGDDELARLTLAFNRLLDALGQKEATLLEQKSALELADRAKTEFLANLSHEIRTPLNGLLGITDLLAMEENDPERLALIEQMRGAGNDLRGLLERILDLAQLEMGRVKLNPQPVVLAEALTGAATRMQRVARAKGLTLVTDIAPDLPEAVLLDGKRLVQILALLLDNAVKFSDAGTIIVAARRPAGVDLRTSLEIDVADQGVGIPADQVERVFESFVQGDGSTTRKAGGNGLGLAIAKRLVLLMQGTISVHARPEGGTVMRLRLPLEISGAPG